MTDRKKWARWLLYAAELLLLFFLQETPGLMPLLMGVKPFLVLAAVLTVAMAEDPVPAMLLGAFAGLLQDFGGGSPMGYHGLVFAVLCYLLSGICGTRMQIHLFTAILLGLAACLPPVLLDWLLLYMAAGYSMPAYALLRVYLPLYFYTLLMIPPCYGIQKLIQRVCGRYGMR
ncbi:MAG: rod shape-determining protein MreD [Clostridia bacterium]|nr:rod shape-determining protein MreD [Clostridia bacterium]